MLLGWAGNSSVTTGSDVNKNSSGGRHTVVRNYNTANLEQQSLTSQCMSAIPPLMLISILASKFDFMASFFFVCAVPFGTAEASSIGKR